MRNQIKESVERMTREDCEDVAVTCGLPVATKKEILKHAIADEAVAEYVLQY